MLSGCAGKHFENAKILNSYNAYNEFLIEYGGSKYADEARFLRAKSANSFQEYANYLKSDPPKKFRDQVEKLLFQLAENWKCAYGYNVYLNFFSAKKRRNIEKLYWEATKIADQVHQYDQFLKIFPDSNYVQEAKELKLLRVNKVLDDNYKGLKKEIRLTQVNKFNIKEAAFSPTGKYIAIGGAEKYSENKTIVIINTSNGKEINSYKTNDFRQLTFSPDGKYLISAIENNEGFHEFLTGKKVFQSLPDVDIAVFSTDSRYLIGIKGSKMNFWDINKNWKKKHLERCYPCDAKQLIFSPDWRFIVCSGKHVIRNVNSGYVQYDHYNPIREALYINTNEQYIDTHDYVQSIDISHDGKYLISGGGTTVKLFKYFSLVREYEAHSRKIKRYNKKYIINSVCFSKDDKHFISGGLDKKIVIYDINKDNPIKEILVDNEINSLDISPDNQLIVSASSEGTVKIWTAPWVLDQEILTSKKLDKQSYEIAHKNNTTNDYKNYVSSFSNGQFVNEANNLAFSLYKKNNTIEGYNEFLKCFPSAADQEEALTLVFNLYEKQNTIDGYNEFLEKHSYSIHKTKAIQLVFNLYQQQDTIEGYNEFMSKYPYSPEKIDALYHWAIKTNTLGAYDRFLDELNRQETSSKQRKSEILLRREPFLFDWAKQNNTLTSYEKYIHDYPDGQFVREAKTNKEKPLFEEIQKENTIEGYKKYLKEYPKGKYITKVKKRLDEVCFKKARQDDTIESYETYINQNPSGLYVTEAMRLKKKIIARLEKAAEKDYNRLIRGNWRGDIKFTFRSYGKAFRLLEKIKRALHVRDPAGFFNPYWVTGFHGAAAKGDRGVIVGVWYTSGFQGYNKWGGYLKRSLSRIDGLASWEVDPMGSSYSSSGGSSSSSGQVDWVSVNAEMVCGFNACTKKWISLSGGPGYIDESRSTTSISIHKSYNGKIGGTYQWSGKFGNKVCSGTINISGTKRNYMIKVYDHCGDAGSYEY